MSEFRDHTYIRRRGRMTKAQARAFQSLTADYMISPGQVVTVAGEKLLGIEIGFGMGHALLQWALAAGEWSLFGIDLYQPGIGALTDKLYRNDIANVSLLEYPAQEVVAAISDACIDEVRIYFPDPWPKKRHHKRRLIQPEFAGQLERVLKSQGIVRLATDWVPYAHWMRECFAGCGSLELQLDWVRAADTDPPGDTVREVTHFERRGERLGHDITDLVYVKK